MFLYNYIANAIMFFGKEYNALAGFCLDAVSF